jgi:SMI1-KNR4 cell-wall
MKSLTIKKDYRNDISLEDLKLIEKKYSITLPYQIKKIIFDYHGSSVLEHVYYDKKENLFHSFNQFLFLKKYKIGASIEAIYEGHLEVGIKHLIPFAIDSGGWDFNFSIGEDTFGQIWLDCFDSNEENPYMLIAPSLEEFIDGLITEKEAIELGY